MPLRRYSLKADRSPPSPNRAPLRQPTPRLRVSLPPECAHDSSSPSRSSSAFIVDADRSIQAGVGGELAEVQELGEPLGVHLVHDGLPEFPLAGPEDVFGAGGEGEPGIPAELALELAGAPPRV